MQSGKMAARKRTGSTDRGRAADTVSLMPRVWVHDLRIFPYVHMAKRRKILMSRLKSSQTKAEHVAQIVKAIAHPIRLRILAILCEGAENVTTLALRLDAAQSLISQHLRVMRSEGLVVADRRGSQVYYALARERLRSLIRYLEDCP